MIGTRTLKIYCNGDYTLIENYDKAIADTTKTWHCHHRRETDEGLSTEKLKKMNLYYKVAPSELIFLTPKDHAQLHMIEYNKSEKHRQEAIASNKRRWKDGCPEETRNKMSKSLTGKAKNKIWMRKDDKTIMIKPEEYDEYISKGYIKGRGSNCPWNTKRKKLIAKNNDKL